MDSKLSTEAQPEVTGAVAILKINEHGEYSLELPYSVDSEEAYAEFVSRLGGPGEYKLYPPSAIQAMQAIIDLSAAPAPSPCTPKEAEELAKQTLGYFPKKSHLISCITFNELAAIINADRSKR